jgi:succinylglutamic semialdehyde dehydrogenase
MDNFIGGLWVAGEGEALTSFCPATGDLVWMGRSVTAEQLAQACIVARSAAVGWSRTPASERAGVAARYQEALERHADEMARIISREVGKPLWESKTEVASMIGKVGISQTAYLERTGERSATSTGATALLTHRPHGVLAVLGPYNFPGHLANGHIVPALLAGNCVVFKPSEYAPGVASLMVRCPG